MLANNDVCVANWWPQARINRFPNHSKEPVYLINLIEDVSKAECLIASVNNNNKKEPSLDSFKCCGFHFPCF